MKNFSLVFSIILISTFFLACSNDDDSTAVNEDVIVGEWRLAQVIEGGIDVPLQTCDLLETYFFNADFSFRAEAYEPDQGTQECVISNFTEGVWGKSNNDQYFTNTSGDNFPFVAEFSDDEIEMTIVIVNTDFGINERRTYEKQED